MTLLALAYSDILASVAGIEEQPLAARSGPRGATLFVTVSPDESGVRTENAYADPEMWGRRSREFDLGGIGTGVAIGDYDGDGRPDLFVVSKTESCRLFRNLGDWKFEDVTEKAGIGDSGPGARIWKQGATFADVNNDSRLDLYLCRFGAPNLLYINQGDGTFKEEAQARGLDVKDASIMAAFGDYDRDGWLDVFVQTNVLDAVAGSDGQRDFLFHNNGDGTFTNVSERSGVCPGPTHGNSALWWDFDGDHWPDLYVANDFAVPDALYRNNSDGTFSNVIADVMPSVPYSSMGSDLGDVNNDGRLDLLVADMAATTHVKDQRTMAETRARMRLPEPGAPEVRQFPVSTLFLNTGVRRCLEAAHLAGVAATDWTWSPRWEDLDNDGRVDLHITNGMYREIHNQDLIGRRSSAGSMAVAGQITRNSPVLTESNRAFRNRGDLRFEDVSAAWGLDHQGVSFGSALGDLDGDGDLDLLYANYQAGATLLRNDSDTGHRIVCALRGTRSNRFGIGAQVTVETSAGLQMRVLDLARGFMSSSEPIAHFGLGDQTQVRRLTVRWPNGAEQTFENLPVDRRFTITEPDAEEPLAGARSHEQDPDSRSRERQRVDSTAGAPRPELGDAAFDTQFTEVSETMGLSWTAAEETYDEFLDQRLLPQTFNRRGPALAVGDLDGSGRDAVCIGGTTLQPLRVLLPQPNNRWAPSDSVSLAEPPVVNDGPLLVFDANGDGYNDLLVTAGGASAPVDAPEYHARLFLNDGRGYFEPAPTGMLPAIAISAGATCVADFDHDGQPDVFIGGRVSPGQYPAAPQSVLLTRNGQTFSDLTDEAAPALRRVGMVTAALWSDVDDDGWCDLVLALDWGPVKYFHNQAGKAFEDWTEKAGFAAAGTGWWRSLAAADFNRDGRPDFAAGNLGNNTGYRADTEHPALLFVGDFGGRGTAELVEAYHDEGVLYPRRSRSDLGAAIPSVFKRYRFNNDYAKATLPDIVGADRLAAATRWAATELRSGVFLSQPDGTYRFEPWPQLAQVAPANGLAAGDFDGDGHADIYVVQNSYAPAPAHGRFDGGLSQFLRGDGRGGFTPVPPIESGLVVPGDAKALAVLDLDEDGWPDFVVSRNGGTTLAFRNRGVAGRRSLRVVLQTRSADANDANVESRTVAGAASPRPDTAKPATGAAKVSLRGVIGARVVAEYADGSTATSEVHAGSGYYSQSGSSLFYGFTDQNPLRRVRVRWPNGRTTETELTGEFPAVLHLAPPRP